MNETSYIKLPAEKVQALCEAKVAFYEKYYAERVREYSAKWRSTWRARFRLFITRQPLNDLAAAWKWSDYTYAHLYPWWVRKVDRLLEASKSGGEMLVSVSDYDIIKED